MIRGSVVLPHGLGKSVTVAVFAKVQKLQRQKRLGLTMLEMMILLQKSKVVGQISIKQ